MYSFENEKKKNGVRGTLSLQLPGNAFSSSYYLQMPSINSYCLGNYTRYFSPEKVNTRNAMPLAFNLTFT